MAIHGGDPNHLPISHEPPSKSSTTAKEANLTKLLVILNGGDPLLTTSVDPVLGSYFFKQFPPAAFPPQSARPSGKDFRTLPEENATAIEAGLWHGPVWGAWRMGSQYLDTWLITMVYKSPG